MDRQIVILKDNKLYLSSILGTIQSKNELVSMLNDEHIEILRIQNEISKLCVATPSGITPPGRDPYEYVSNKLNALFDELSDCYDRLHSLIIAQNAINAQPDKSFHEVIPDMYADLKK